MKVTLFSNFLNHHQLPLCEELHLKLGENFKFVATEKIDKERLLLGYHNLNNMTFVVNSYESKEQFNEALMLGYESDIVIIGSAPDLFIKERMKANKLTFRYSERIFKGNYFLPRLLKYTMKNWKYHKKRLYMLCSSAYVPYDMKLCNAFGGKTYKWGYFPEIVEYDIPNIMNRKHHNVIEIIWVGRLLSWKHPDYVIEIARMLKALNYKFHISIIGIGEKESKLKRIVDKYQLNNEVAFLGSMSPEKVREYMEMANIFLFTSDYGEGWGAVLNEAMNSCCAVVASHAAGSTPYLISHNDNGLMFESGNVKELFKHVKWLMDNPLERERLGVSAYLTMKNMWNAGCASTNLLVLSEQLLYINDLKIDKGPCSIAKVIKPKKSYKSIFKF